MKKEITREMNWFIDVTFVCGILIGAIIVYASSKGFFANTKTWKSYFSIPTIFSVLGIILMVHSIIVNNWEVAIMGALIFLGSFPPYALLRKRIKLNIFHRLCILVVVVLGYYYVFQLTFWGILLLIAGAVGLVDTIHLIIRRKL